MTTLPLGSGAYERLAAGVPQIVLQNRWVEMAPTNQREHVLLLSRPGTTPQLAINAINAGAFAGLGPMRGNYWFPGLFNDALFVVCGSNLYRIDQAPITAALTVTLIAGQINGSAQNHPEVAWQKGIGYERLFISDGLLLQYYGGPSNATATLSLNAQPVAGTDSFEVGGVYFAFAASFNSTDAGTPANPFLINPFADGAAQIVKALTDTGTPGVDYSATITGAINNLQAWSQDLTKTVAWTNPAAMVLTNNVFADPVTGAIDAQAVQPAAASAVQNFHTVTVPGLTNSGLYSYTAYFRAFGYRYVRMSLANAANSSEVYAEFDLTGGVILTPATANGGSSPVASMTYAGNGWYRCQISGVAGGAGGVQGHFYLIQGSEAGVASSALPAWTPNGVSGIYSYGHQITPGAAVQLYSETNGAVGLPAVSAVENGGPPGTSVVVTSLYAGADSNNTASTIVSGGHMTFSSATLLGGGVNALAGVTMPDGVTAGSLTQVSSYVLVAEASTQQFFWINPGEIVIDPLDFASKESSPDPIIAMRTTGDQAIIMGSGSTENWYATGDLAAPFAPIEGRVYQRGAIAGTPCVVSDAVMLVGNDGIAYEIGYAFGTGSDWGVHRISNNGIEERIRRQIRRQAGLKP